MKTIVETQEEVQLENESALPQKEEIEELKEKISQDKEIENLLDKLVEALPEINNKTMEELKVLVEGLLTEDLAEEIAEESNISLEEIAQNEEISIEEVKSIFLNAIRDLALSVIYVRIQKEFK